MARVLTTATENLGTGGFFPPIPTGSKLEATIFDIVEGVTGPNSKKPGTPQFNYTAKITQDFEYEAINPATGAVGRYNAAGREIRFNYVPLDATANNAWNLYAFGEAVGWKIEEGTDANGKPTKSIEVPDNLNDVLGTKVTIQVGVSSYEKDGETFVNNRVSRITKAGKSAAAPATQAASWDSL